MKQIIDKNMGARKHLVPIVHMFLLFSKWLQSSSFIADYTRLGLSLYEQTY